MIHKKLGYIEQTHMMSPVVIDTKITENRTLLSSRPKGSKSKEEVTSSHSSQ